MQNFEIYRHHCSTFVKLLELGVTKSLKLLVKLGAKSFQILV